MPTRLRHRSKINRRRSMRRRGGLLGLAGVGEGESGILALYGEASQGSWRDRCGLLASVAEKTTASAGAGHGGRHELDVVRRSRPCEVAGRASWR